MKFIEKITNIWYYIYKFIIDNAADIASRTDLTGIIPEKDTNLELSNYSDIIRTVKHIGIKIVKTLPKDERLIHKFGILERIVSILLYMDHGISYKIKTDAEAIESTSLKIQNDLFYDNPIGDIEEIIRKDVFYRNFTNENDYYVIDSLFMQKYEYRKGILPPVIKAYFIKDEDDSLILDHFIYNDKHVYRTSENFVLCKRVLNNYIVLDTVIYRHLYISHLSSGEIFSFYIRKHLSSGNKLKQFLWNFCYGTMRINNSTSLLLGENSGGLIKFFPFTKSSMVDYLSDFSKRDNSLVMYPSKKDYNSNINEDCVALYNIYLHHLLKMTEILSNDELEEMQRVIEDVKNHDQCHRDKTNEEILASFIYTVSVEHHLSGTRISRFLKNGHTYPASIDIDGTVRKYDYLYTMCILSGTSSERRKTIINLPKNYDRQVIDVYESMCTDMRNQDLKYISPTDLPSSIQV